MARERLVAERVTLGKRLAREREKAEAYFEAQEAAVRQIAIDSIRQVRLDDLYRSGRKPWSPCTAAATWCRTLSWSRWRW